MAIFEESAMVTFVLVDEKTGPLFVTTPSHTGSYLPSYISQSTNQFVYVRNAAEKPNQ